MSIRNMTTKIDTSHLYLPITAGNEAFVIDVFALPQNSEVPKHYAWQFEAEVLNKFHDYGVHTFDVRNRRNLTTGFNNFVQKHLTKILEFSNAKILLVESAQFPGLGWEFTLFENDIYVCNICHQVEARIVDGDVFMKERQCYPIPCEIIIQKYKDIVAGIKIDWKWWGKQQILHGFDYFDQPKPVSNYLECQAKRSMLESVEFGPQRWTKLGEGEWGCLQVKDGDQLGWIVYDKKDRSLGWEFTFLEGECLICGEKHVEYVDDSFQYDQTHHCPSIPICVFYTRHQRMYNGVKIDKNWWKEAEEKYNFDLENGMKKEIEYGPKCSIVLKKDQWERVTSNKIIVKDIINPYWAYEMTGDNKNRFKCTTCLKFKAKLDIDYDLVLNLLHQCQKYPLKYLQDKLTLYENDFDNYLKWLTTEEKEYIFIRPKIKKIELKIINGIKWIEIHNNQNIQSIILGDINNQKNGWHFKKKSKYFICTICNFSKIQFGQNNFLMIDMKHECTSTPIKFLIIQYEQMIKKRIENIFIKHNCQNFSNVPNDDLTEILDEPISNNLRKRKNETKGQRSYSPTVKKVKQAYPQKTFTPTLKKLKEVYPLFLRTPYNLRSNTNDEENANENIPKIHLYKQGKIYEWNSKKFDNKWELIKTVENQITPKLNEIVENESKKSTSMAKTKFVQPRKVFPSHQLSMLTVKMPKNIVTTPVLVDQLSQTNTEPIIPPVLSVSPMETNSAPINSSKLIRAPIIVYRQGPIRFDSSTTFLNGTARNPIIIPSIRMPKIHHLNITPDMKSETNEANDNSEENEIMILENSEANHHEIPKNFLVDCESGEDSEGRQISEVIDNQSSEMIQTEQTNQNLKVEVVESVEQPLNAVPKMPISVLPVVRLPFPIVRYPQPRLPNWKPRNLYIPAKVSINQPQIKNPTIHIPQCSKSVKKYPLHRINAPKTTMETKKVSEIKSNEEMELDDLVDTSIVEIIDTNVIEENENNEQWDELYQEAISTVVTLEMESKNNYYFEKEMSFDDTKNLKSNHELRSEWYENRKKELLEFSRKSIERNGKNFHRSTSPTLIRFHQDRRILRENIAKRKIILKNMMNEKSKEKEKMEAIEFNMEIDENELKRMENHRLLHQSLKLKIENETSKKLLLYGYFEFDDIKKFINDGIENQIIIMQCLNDISKLKNYDYDDKLLILNDENRWNEWFQVSDRFRLHYLKKK